MTNTTNHRQMFYQTKLDADVQSAPKPAYHRREQAATYILRGENVTTNEREQQVLSFESWRFRAIKVEETISK